MEKGWKILQDIFYLHYETAARLYYSQDTNGKHWGKWGFAPQTGAECSHALLRSVGFIPVYSDTAFK